MWVIIERYEDNPRRGWIAGVFKKLQTAKKYLSIAKDFHKKYGCSAELRKIPAKDYPVMFVEDFENFEFTYVTIKELAKKLFALEKVEDEDHQYCMYFIFHQDYQGPTPGQDYLGATDHHHVYNHEIIGLIEDGLEIRNESFRGLYSCENCRKLTAGVLSEKGYELPPGWQIILNDPSKSKKKDTPKRRFPVYLPVCSEKCRKNLARYLPL